VGLGVEKNFDKIAVKKPHDMETYVVRLLFFHVFHAKARTSAPKGQGPRRFPVLPGFFTSPPSMGRTPVVLPVRVAFRRLSFSPPGGYAGGTESPLRVRWRSAAPEGLPSVRVPPSALSSRRVRRRIEYRLRNAGGLAQEALASNRHRLPVMAHDKTESVNLSI
jgi:hypothetical protein